MACIQLDSESVTILPMLSDWKTYRKAVKQPEYVSIAFRLEMQQAGGEKDECWTQ